MEEDKCFNLWDSYMKCKYKQQKCSLELLLFTICKDNELTEYWDNERSNQSIKNLVKK